MVAQFTGPYEEAGKEIGALVDHKQAAYGNSFAVSGQFLELLYPNGMRVGDYDDALLLIRIFDKLKRIATGATDENSWGDIAGYALLGMRAAKARGE